MKASSLLLLPSAGDFGPSSCWSALAERIVTVALSILQSVEVPLPGTWQRFELEDITSPHRVIRLNSISYLIGIRKGIPKNHQSFFALDRDHEQNCLLRASVKLRASGIIINGATHDCHAPKPSTTGLFQMDLASPTRS